MKKLITLFSLVISMLFSYSQNDFTDEVYPSNGEKPYLNCMILEIENDNIVTFIYQDQKYTLQAISIKKDGKYIDFSEFVEETPQKNLKDNKQEISNLNVDNEVILLYRGHDYDYYLQKSLKARKKRNTGIMLTGFGVLTSIIGYRQHYSSVLILGSLCIEGGIATWIVGGIVNHNNKKAMKQFDRDKLSLNMGATNNGVGLVLRF